jgi:hypothetical protein
VSEACPDLRRSGWTRAQAWRSVAPAVARRRRRERKPRGHIRHVFLSNGDEVERKDEDVVLHSFSRKIS